MNTPVLPGRPPEIISRSAFRRGRLWTLVAVTGTATIWSGAFVQPLVRYGPAMLSLKEVGAALLFLGFLAWLGLRGGRIITACLILMIAPICLGFAVESSGIVIQISLPVKYWPDYIRNDAAYENPREIAFSITISVFANISLWAFLLSRDARLYRRVRRRQIVEQEANAFEWPPIRRHPQ